MTVTFIPHIRRSRFRDLEVIDSAVGRSKRVFRQGNRSVVANPMEAQLAETTLGDDFRKDADALINGLQKMVTNWRQLERETKQAYYEALDETAKQVIAVMAQQEPTLSSAKRRKWFLKPEYAAYFKEKGVPVSNSAEYPFNPPFKLVMYPDMDWSTSVTDPAKIKERENANSEISNLSNVAALGMMRDKKVSELIEEYGGVRAASDAFRVQDADEKAAHKKAEAIRQQKIRDAQAAENKALKEKADAEKKANAEKEAQEKAAEKEAQAEARRIDAERKEAEKAALKAETARRAAEALTAKANRMMQETEARRVKAEKEAEEARIQQEAAEKAAEEARIANEKREAELAEEARLREIEIKRMEEEEAARKKAEEANARVYKLSSTKDRKDVLVGLEKSGAWLKVEMVKNEWLITSVQPAKAVDDIAAAIHGTPDVHIKPKAKPNVTEKTR